VELVEAAINAAVDEAPRLLGSGADVDQGNKAWPAHDQCVDERADAPNRFLDI
jgi:hypothetical protein